MTLTDRTEHPDRRTEDTVPPVERRQHPERRVPEWRRRQLEAAAQAGDSGRFLAVTDLTDRSVA